MAKNSKAKVITPIGIEKVNNFLETCNSMALQIAEKWYDTHPPHDADYSTIMTEQDVHDIIGYLNQLVLKDARRTKRVDQARTSWKRK